MYLLLDLPLSVIVHMGFLLGTAKVLTLDWKLRKPELLYIALASLLTSIMRIFVLGVHLPNLSAHVFDDMMFSAFILLYIPVVFIYFFKVRAYPRRKAAILTSVMMSIVFASDAVIDLTFAQWLPGMRLYPGMTPSQYPAEVLVHMVLHHALAFAVAVLIIKTTGKLRTAVKQNRRLQLMFMHVCTVVLAAVPIWQLLTYPTEYVLRRDGLPWSEIAIFALMYIFLAASFFHAKHVAVRNKQEEYQTLKQYTEEIERQQLAMRKFKHDYQNILISMSGYIQNEDLAGLKQYYSSKVEAAAEVITKDSSVLDGLSKIKVPEIKSILAAKLMLAQNINIGIHTTFEANEVIDHIPVDSILLVRMLGIILDNAVDALAELGRGSLFVACIKWEGGITFVVQNTCCPDVPPLQQMWQPGFSTKGEGRGLGLPLLSELVDACPNVTLKTSIITDRFSQELLIEATEESI